MVMAVCLVVYRQRMEINDSWIAAMALAHDWAVVTQDLGFPSSVPELNVIVV